MVDEDSSPSPDNRGALKVKKRRLHGACDTCRKRKIKCDSAVLPGNTCTNCQLSNTQCTHDIPRQPKKKDAQQAYIQNLEDRLQKLEHVLQTLHPEKDIDVLVSSPEAAESVSSTSNIASSSKDYSIKYPMPPGLSADAKDQIPSTSKDNPAEEAEDLAHVALSEHLSQLSINAVEDRFFGQSSAFMFVKHAMQVRKEVTGSANWDPSQFRRPLYWDLRPWEMAFASIPEPAYVYPPQDLLHNLVSLYFEKANYNLPVLHRPTFMKTLAQGQHIWDPSFGMTVLLVCAVGSRYSHDPRVLVDGDTSGLSSGWNYFSQVPIHRNPSLYRSTIYDIQYYTLAIIYLLGTSIPHAAWNILGLGLRFTLEKGVHRRKGNQKPTAEDELLKRGFWSLICVDRLMSSFLGRPCAVQDEDFDVDYPIECDDEYWETDDPDLAFKQPPGKPCKITAFVCSLKLCEILAFSLRTLYSTKKSKMLSGLIGPEWENRVVAELDSSMNKWKDSLPHFLRWDPEREDPTFFHQSASIHAMFYYLQIQIHRPFLTKKSALTFSSLAMCTNASRSCCHILDVSLTRGLRPYPSVFIGAFAAGVVILLNLWGNHRSGLIADPDKEMENVQKCFGVLKECEKTWHIAGRLSDLLKEVGSLTEHRSPSMKRQRDSESTESSDCEAQTQRKTRPPPSAWQPVIPQVPVPTPISAPMNSAMPSFDTAATMPANDWDLSNLLMAQMGYIQQQQQHVSRSQPIYSTGTSIPYMTGVIAHETPDPCDDRMAGMGYVPEFVKPGHHQYSVTTSSTNVSERKASDDFLSLWSDLPVSFSAEEWETFLSANVNMG